MAVAVAGAALASGPELTGAVSRRPVLLACVAAAGFGFALFALDRGARASLLHTLWGMRLVSVTVFCVAALATRSLGGAGRRDLPVLAAIGLGDVSANALFAFASSRGLVSVASVLGSLYPVATLVWARVLLGERLRAGAARRCRPGPGRRGPDDPLTSGTDAAPWEDRRVSSPAPSVAPTLRNSALVRAARREEVPHTPVWFMRQAGRSLPEYRKVREGIAMLDSCRDPDLVTEITLQPVRRHGVDAAIFFSDIVVPLAAVGVDLDIVPGVGPVVAAAVPQPRRPRPAARAHARARPRHHPSRCSS